MGLFHKSLKTVKNSYLRKNKGLVLKELKKRQDHVQRLYRAMELLKVDLDYVHESLKGLDSNISEKTNIQENKDEKLNNDPFIGKIDELKKRFGNMSENIKQLKVHTKLCK